MSHLNFKVEQSANLLSTAQRRWRGIYNWVPSVRAWALASVM